MRLPSARDMVSALMCMTLGALVTIEASGYNLGTAARMGTGYFPFHLGLLLTACGIGILVTATLDRLADGEADAPEARVQWRALLALPAAIVVFALAVETAGLAAAAFLAAFVSTFADPRLGLLRSLTVALVVAFFCVAVFRWGLGLQVRALPW